MSTYDSNTGPGLNTMAISSGDLQAETQPASGPGLTFTPHLHSPGESTLELSGIGCIDILELSLFCFLLLHQKGPVLFLHMRSLRMVNNNNNNNSYLV